MPLEKRLCYVLIAILITQSVALIITHMCLCIPFRALWTMNIPGAKCANRTVVYFIRIGFNIAMDFAVLVAPASILRHLHLPWPQMLLIGTFLAFGAV